MLMTFAGCVLAGAPATANAGCPEHGGNDIRITAAALAQYANRKNLSLPGYSGNTGGVVGDRPISPAVRVPCQELFCAVAMIIPGLPVRLGPNGRLLRPGKLPRFRMHRTMKQ